jgi:hypothetical protein
MGRSKYDLEAAVTIVPSTQARLPVVDGMDVIGKQGGQDIRRVDSKGVQLCTKASATTQSLISYA